MSPEEAKQIMVAFRRKRVGHRVAKNVRERLFRMILTADREQIIALVGPAGVGKSAVVERLREMLIEHYMDDMKSNLGFLPFIYLSAKTGLDGDFDWKDLHARALREANEPLISRKTTFDRYRLDGQEINSTKGLPKGDLRRVFESTIEERGVRIVFFDEASAIIDAAVNRNIVRQFNILKSLAIQKGIVIVMIGAYDLLGINGGNGQLVRRAHVVHMPRYAIGGVTLPVSDNDQESDMDVFASSADMLAAAAPVDIEPLVLQDSQLVMAKSVGCFGIFRDWLDRACMTALTTNNGVLTSRIFEAEALPNSKLIKLSKEANLGELEIVDSSEDELASLLGLSSLRTSESPDSQVVASKPKRTRALVGQRGPSRDRVGDRRA